MPYILKKFLLLVFSLSLAVVFAASSGLAQVSAEKAEKGRLADGRAYRVDDRGYRLVDRVAELEVSNDDLKRQNRALEDELADLRRLMGKLGKGAHPQASPLKEKDLFPSSEPRSDRRTIPSGIVAKDIDPPNCNDLVSSLYVKLARLEKDLKRKPTTTQTGACDYNSPDNPLWEQVTRLQTALMDNPSKESLAREIAEREELEQKYVLVKKQLTKETGKADAFEQELDLAKKELSSLEENLSSAQSKLGRTKGKTQASHRRESRARMKTAAPREERKKVSSSPQHSNAALSGARTEFKKDLRKIQKQISKRKSLLDKLKKQKRNVSIQVQPLVTRNGLSLDRLRSEVAGLNQHSDIGGIRIALREIHKIIMDDIAVMNRLLQGRRG